nr:immunoglobulin light chain junction region [Macaca mulatta]MOW10620.1 immunoglobulin light chain junction region [Macaca mulatta]MOW10953.1 immunoglobulin light chain junction region [Macaca mulatta]MOW11666.1 immunoglobulin light chain junction region [Macaca mulatta]MOW12306.1 immunoglobulin light chain junction region [Macaca mulatta]
CMQYTHFPPTF